MSRRVLPALLLLAAACRFDTSGHPADGPSKWRDRIDANQLAEVAPEAASERHVAADLARRDRTPLDKPPALDKPQPKKTCDEIYDASSLWYYKLCQQTATTCVFYKNSWPDKKSCDEFCQERGGSCISSSEESGDYPFDIPCSVDPSTTYTCKSSDYNQNCTCTRF